MNFEALCKKLPKHTEDWTNEDIMTWLEHISYEHLKPNFKIQGVDGIVLLTLTDEILQNEFNVAKQYERKKILYWKDHFQIYSIYLNEQGVVNPIQLIQSQLNQQNQPQLQQTGSQRNITSLKSSGKTDSMHSSHNAEHSVIKPNPLYNQTEGENQLQRQSTDCQDQIPNINETRAPETQQPLQQQSQKESLQDQSESLGHLNQLDLKRCRSDNSPAQQEEIPPLAKTLILMNQAQQEPQAGEIEAKCKASSQYQTILTQYRQIQQCYEENVRQQQLLRNLKYVELNLDANNKPEIKFGRDQSNHYAISNMSAISSFHCKLTKKGPSYYLQDTKSLGGTYLLVSESAHRQLLKDGDLLQLEQLTIQMVQCKVQMSKLYLQLNITYFDGKQDQQIQTIDKEFPLDAVIAVGNQSAADMQIIHQKISPQQKLEFQLQYTQAGIKMIKSTPIMWKKLCYSRQVSEEVLVYNGDLIKIGYDSSILYRIVLDSNQ